MRKSVNELYKYSKDNATPLLGSNQLDFWQPYIANSTVFDRYFRDKFLSWRYWLSFSDDATIADIFSDFVEAVQSHLNINSKRYSELYRVHTLANSAYDIVNNYDLTEAHTITRSDSATDVSGARSDSTSGSVINGSRTDSKSGSNVDGSRSDSTDTTFVSGEREDTQSGTAVDGERVDSSSTTAGAQITTEEKQIEGFNSAAYSDADKTTVNAGAHTDSTSVEKGEQTNTTDTTLNKGEQTDTTSITAVKGQQSNTFTESDTIGSQTNTTAETINKGAQTDTHTGSGSESISIHRYGNIGVQTPADIIGGHIELWDAFNFYGLIFNEIAKAYLLISEV